MLDVLAITAPIFLLIGVGYGAVRFGLFTRDEVRPMGRFVLNFALPALLFLSLAGQPIETIANPAFLAAYGFGSLFMLLAGFAIFRLRGRPVSPAAVLGIGMAGSNNAFIGLPVALQFFGPIGSVAVALAMLVENLINLPVVLALAEWGEGGDRGRWRRVRAALANLARNPLLLAIVAGTAVAIIGVPMPKPAATLLDLLARASTGLALFVIGGLLVGVRARGLAGDVAILTIGKLVFHPLAVGALVLLLLPNDPLGPVAVVLAAVSMLSIFPILAQRYGIEDVASAALVIATAISFVTLTLLLWML
jgi:malonate transporter and related proteins